MATELNGRRARSTSRRSRVRRAASGDQPLRIAMLAPPWFPIPPPAYGGIESVVHLLTEQLVEDGHDVTLFCAPGSCSIAQTVEVLDAAHPDEIGCAMHEVTHVAAVFDAVDRAAAERRPFDLLHDHAGFMALAMARRLSVPVVHTAHGPFDSATEEFYRRCGANGMIVGLSRSQLADAPPLRTQTRVIPNPIRISDWPVRERTEDHLLWIGRMNEEKGPHRAIDVARRAGKPLVLAGPVQPGQEPFFEQHVAPQLDAPDVTYLGEVGADDKKDLFARASALLMPIRWHEPFGMVMIEAMACGTPVIAFPEGAASEIVISGENGFLVDDAAEMAAAVDRIGDIDRARCRELVGQHFDVRRVAALYADAYRQAIGRKAGAKQRPGRRKATAVPALSNA
jgi:glycosyltransferase involved in cell wall biosynthesis